MRQKLLITTAIAGLLAGTMFAAAQNMPKQGGAEGGAPSGQVQHNDQGTGKQAPQGRQNQREQGKQGTTGQGGPQAGEGKQGQRDQGKQGEHERGKQGTTGQGSDRDSKQGQREQGKQGEREGGKQGTTGQGREEQGRQGAQPRQNEQNGQARQPSTQGKANITQDQRTRLRERVLAHGPRISNNVHISINVGTVIPSSVRVVAVPEEIIEIYPDYRGYFYFVYEDEIVIVDRAHHIVAVIAV